MTVRQWLQHALAVEPQGPCEPTERQRVLVERICQAIVRRRLIMPALLGLELFRPSNFLAAQMLHFLGPLATVLLDASSYEELARFLERRGSVDFISQRIEAIQKDRQRESPGVE